MGTSVQLLPPSVENPIPIPWAPPFDFRSWWNAAIALLPCTATWGSTSALRNVLPVSELSCVEQAAYGDGPLTSTGTIAAIALDGVTSASPPASAEIQTALRTNSHPPLAPPRHQATVILQLTLTPAGPLAQPGHCVASLRRLERAHGRDAGRRRIEGADDEVARDAADDCVDCKLRDAPKVELRQQL